ncbi:hypothetical protein KRX54_00690 [Actinomycetaceae bacterium TAE3-ERU4]|nr:hypothetical protein [Actinomycetaceae bacterium TAE3-ERU4]
MRRMEDAKKPQTNIPVPLAQQPPSLKTAYELLSQLVQAGVRDVVLCPGSRSAPLAYALAAAEESGKLRAHICADERAAGFYALGLAKAAQAFGIRDSDIPSYRSENAVTYRAPASSSAALETPTAAPPVIITTSGTAVANLHPAVLEATHSSIPLLVITADRPHELRDTGANQTTSQVGIFGSAPVYEFDLPNGYSDTHLAALVRRSITASLGLLSNRPGVVHLNTCFSDPLTPTFPLPQFVSGALRALPGQFSERSPQRSEPVELDPHFLLDFSENRSVVVAGDSAGPEAAFVALSLGWPLLAEPSSRARGWERADECLQEIIAPVDYQQALGLHTPSDLAKEVKQVLVMGRPTLSRPVTRLLSSAPKVVVSADWAIWPEALGNGAEVVATSDLLSQVRAHTCLFPASYSSWARQWEEEGTARLGDDPRPWACAQVWEKSILDQTPLFLGASSTIRFFDRFSGALSVQKEEIRGEAPVVFANRGLAGIDGNIATGRGIATHLGTPIRLVLGDLTFLHDVTSLLDTFAKTLLPFPGIQIILFDDQGGSIFAGLEHAQASPEVFSRFFLTPQEVRIEELSVAMGANYRQVLPAELIHGSGNWLTSPQKGKVEILHIKLANQNA